MKILSRTNLFLIFWIFSLHQNFATAQPANKLYSDLVVASDKNDRREIGQLIEEGETLWDTNPTPYLNYEMLAIAKLKDSDPSDSLKIFDNVMEKKSPKDIIGASNYILKKRIFILKCFTLGLISTNQVRLLKVAQFVGEVRAMTISGYVIPPEERNRIENQWGWYNNGLHSIKKLPPTIPYLETNTPDLLKNATNTLQLLLIDTDNSITPLLLKFASRVPLNSPGDSDFIQKISDAARLTGEEREKLKGL